MKYVLDACSLIAYFNGEDGSDKVGKILSDALSGDSSIFIHRVNLFEVYYDLLRSGGDEMTKDAMNCFVDSPITVIDIITDELMKEAARFKLTFKISVADSFALATAKLEEAMLVTADHHEFDAVEKSDDVDFFWIR